MGVNVSLRLSFTMTALEFQSTNDVTILSWHPGYPVLPQLCHCGSGDLSATFSYQQLWHSARKTIFLSYTSSINSFFSLEITMFYFEGVPLTT